MNKPFGVIVTGGCLALVLAGCASFSSTFAGDYRLDCNTIMPPEDATATMRKDCEAVRDKPEALIKFSREASSRWMLETAGQPPSQITMSKNAEGYARGTITHMMAVCEVPRGASVFRFTEKEKKGPASN
jgi:hypothetical protein